MQCTDIDFAYDKFVETVHCIIDETIPCRKITVTESTPPHITPLVKSLLRKRNALMRKGKIDRGNEISVKIGSEFRSSQLSSISHNDTKKLWSAVNTSLNKRHNKLPAKSDADEFNRHFSDIPTDSSYNDITIQNVTDTVEVNKQNTNHYIYEVLHLLSQVKKTSPGPDIWVQQSNLKILSCTQVRKI